VKGERILIVEDDFLLVKLLRMYLEQFEYEVAGVATTGEEAIRQAEELKPDLILMDIILDGEMDGIEAASVIHSRLDVPLIYVTAHGDQETLDRASMTKHAAYLVKPVMRHQLGVEIEKALVTRR